MKRRLWVGALILSLLLGLTGGAFSASAAGVTRVWLYVDRQEAFVNGAAYILDSPATVVNGKMYVPVKFLGDTFGFPVAYDAATNTITMKAGETDVFIDLTAKTTLIGGMPGAFDPTFKIINGKLMAQLTWMMDQIGAEYEYDSKLNRVEVTYNPFAGELPTAQASKPIAKFTFGKPSYKMGEKIKYIDLSYDAEGDGIAFVTWKNKQDAFFAPGEHEVSLQVTDSNGNVSEWFTRKITIENETLYQPLDFHMRHAPVQSIVKLDRSQFANLPKLPMSVTEDTSRTLLVSDSPENITEYGVLYRDTVNGKARLYANHLNMMEQDVQFAIIATNNGTEPVTIETTRQGEVYPSVFVNLIGYQASVDFLVGDASRPKLTVKPGSSAAYVYLPKLAAGQGINLLYDVETSGEVTFSFAAMIPNDPVNAVFDYEELAYDKHVRGTFPVSDLHWNADAASLATGPVRFTLGDNEDDDFVEGYDVFRQGTFENYGNYGLMYKIRIENPGKATVLLRPRAGAFKGAFKLNGEMVLAPVSGIITQNDGVFVLGRTTGDEPYLDIEYTPPAGSFFPIDIVLYPID